MSSHLRSPDPTSDPPVHGTYQSPATDTEAALAEIWCEVLELPRVSVLDNFFDLGGHSVLLHMVQDRIAGRMGKNPPLVDLFTYPTVRALARHLDGDTAGDAPQEARPATERVSSRARLGRQRAQRLRLAGQDQDKDPSGLEGERVDQCE